MTSKFSRHVVQAGCHELKKNEISSSTSMWYDGLQCADLKADVNGSAQLMTFSRADVYVRGVSVLLACDYHYNRGGFKMK
jgi:hypothetical protein